MMLRRLFAVIALAALPTVAAAQTCLGNPSFASGPLNVTVGAAADGNGYGLGLGSTVGWWGGKLITGASVGWDSYRSPERTSQGGSITIGTQRLTEDILEFCPFATAGIDRGTEFTRLNGDVFKPSVDEYGVGVGFGAQLAPERYISIVPYGIIRLTTYTAFLQGLGTTEDITERDTGGVFTFGLGFRFDEWLQLSPTVTVSRFEGADLVIGLRGAMALQIKR
jgi:hypothetical protein